MASTVPQETNLPIRTNDERYAPPPTKKSTPPNAPKTKAKPKIKQMELRNTEAGVVTRFPPEPSGYLHIGHAKAALLNDYFAHEQYPGGTMILRFDDTNTEKEKSEYQDAIREDIELLGVKPDIISYTSNYFDQINDYCIQIIKAGKAYADDTPAEEMSRQRMAREPSSRRDESIENNLARFEEMKTASEAGMKWCIRAKISFDNKNASLRDPVIYRCPASQNPHHRTGTKFKAYPTYQFACPVVDSIEGVTHALRTTEYNDQDAQYKWILKALGLRSPDIWTFSKIAFIRTLMSKRKLTKLVEGGVVSGWDDPRFPTVRGIRRRGMTIEGLRDFMVSQGPSKHVVNMDWHTIWAMNKKVIDQIAPRHTAIDRDHVQCVMKGIKEQPWFEDKEKHAKYKLGTKKVAFSKSVIIEQEDAKTFAVDEEITLMNWGNAFVREIIRGGQKSGSASEEPSNVSSLVLELHLEGDVKKTEKKVTWLSTDQDLVPVELVDFDHLLSKDRLEENDDWEKFLTPETEFKTEAVADCNVKDVKVNDFIQFDRKGYYRCDVAATKESPGIFFKVPTGK